MNAKIYPSSIQGEISVPSSKSHTIRALIIATLAGGRSYIRNPLLSDDCKAAMRIAGQFGSTVTAEDGVWIVDGPVDGLKTPDDIVNVDNSGTTLYFMTSVAALLRDYTVFTGDGGLQKQIIIRQSFQFRYFAKTIFHFRFHIACQKIHTILTIYLCQ